MGAVTAGFGLVEILLGILGGSFGTGVLTISGDFILWRGLVLAPAGGFYLLSLKYQDPLQRRARALLASLMIWIVAGMQILAMILGSIPGSEGWLSSPANFIASYMPPFAPSLFILPLSLFLPWVVRRLGLNE